MKAFCCSRRVRTMERSTKEPIGRLHPMRICKLMECPKMNPGAFPFQNISTPLSFRKLSETHTAPQQRYQHPKVFPLHSLTPLRQSVLALFVILAKCGQSCKIIAQHSTELFANLASQSHLFVSADQSRGTWNL